MKAALYFLHVSKYGDKAEDAAMENLKVSLCWKCSPFDTTTVETKTLESTKTESCTARCSIDDETDELKALVRGQAEKIKQLRVLVET